MPVPRKRIEASRRTCCFTCSQMYDCAVFKVNALERLSAPCKGLQPAGAYQTMRPPLCSRPRETKGPLEAVSIHYRSTSLPRFVAVAGEVPKRKGHRAQ
jgi:hypothetical protein